MAFSDNIYRLRKSEGLSEKEFASLFGVSEADVSGGLMKILYFYRFKASYF